MPMLFPAVACVSAFAAGALIYVISDMQSYSRQNARQEELERQRQQRRQIEFELETARQRAREERQRERQEELLRFHSAFNQDFVEYVTRMDMSRNISYVGSVGNLYERLYKRKPPESRLDHDRSVTRHGL